MDAPGADTPLYSVAAVARHTGVPAVTLRAWERRYGFPCPRRASGGRRLYTQRDIWTVRALRTQTGQGVPISRAIAVLRDGGWPPAAPRRNCRRWAAKLRLTHSAPSSCRRCSTWLPDAPSMCCPRRSACCSVEDVCLGLIQPVLNEIGRRWHSGEASVAQEHFATALDSGTPLEPARTHAGRHGPA